MPPAAGCSGLGHGRRDRQLVMRNPFNRCEIRLGDAVLPAKLIFIPKRPNKTQEAKARGDQISTASPSHLARSGYATVKADDTHTSKHHARRRAPENRE